MKILHLSDEGLPDIRLDRYAYIISKMGYESYFYGNTENKDKHSFNFFKETETKRIPSSVNLGFPFFYQNYRKKFKDSYKKLKPDIVHAHNLISAKICLDLNIPYIYDDHEYWKYQVKARNKVKISLFSKRKFTNKLFTLRIKQWEKKVIKNAETVITVSETIANDHRLINPNSIVIPNFPCSFEINQIQNPPGKENILKILIISNYNSSEEKNSVDKYITHLSKNDIDLTIIGNYNGPDNKNLTSLGFLTTIEMYKKLPFFHVGLNTIHQGKKEVGYFKFSCPNRVFQYLHGGLIPVIHSEMSFLKTIIGEQSIFVNNENETCKFLIHMKNDSDFLKNNPGKIQKFARENLVFDNYEKELLKAYLNVQN